MYPCGSDPLRETRTLKSLLFVSDTFMVQMNVCLFIKTRLSLDKIFIVLT